MYILSCKKQKNHKIYLILSWTRAYLWWYFDKVYILMASKLLYLFIDWETFNKLHLLEQVSGVIRALQTSMMVILTEIVNNVNLKTSTILAKD